MKCCFKIGNGFFNLEDLESILSGSIFYQIENLHILNVIQILGFCFIFSHTSELVSSLCSHTPKILFRRVIPQVHIALLKIFQVIENSVNYLEQLKNQSNRSSNFLTTLDKGEIEEILMEKLIQKALDKYSLTLKAMLLSTSNRKFSEIGYFYLSEPEVGYIF